MYITLILCICTLARSIDSQNIFDNINEALNNVANSNEFKNAVNSIDTQSQNILGGNIKKTLNELTNSKNPYNGINDIINNGIKFCGAVFCRSDDDFQVKEVFMDSYCCDSGCCWSLKMWVYFTGGAALIVLLFSCIGCCYCCCARRKSASAILIHHEQPVASGYPPNYQFHSLNPVETC